MLEEAINSLSDGQRHNVTEILRQRVFNQAQEARAQAKQIAMDSNSKEYRYCEGLGELKMRVPTMAKVYWSNREGEECWNDKKFKKDFLQKNPECRVKTRSGKIMEGFTGDNDFIPTRTGRKVKVYK